MTVVKFPKRAVGRRGERLARILCARPKITTVYDVDLSDEHMRHVYRFRRLRHFDRRRHEAMRYLMTHNMDDRGAIDVTFNAVVNDKPVPHEISEVLLEWITEDRR
jgi:hypothetical protein